MKTYTCPSVAVKLLDGIFCVYKPAGVYTRHVRSTLAGNLAGDLNDLNRITPHPPKDMVKIEGSFTSGKALSVKLVPDFADHPLVVGPRYQPRDFQINNITSLGKRTSGVLVMAINDACRKEIPIRKANVLRKVELKGEFGYATDTFMHDGKVWEKATYGHIERYNLERILASIQASHQSDSFVHSGIDIQSQEAYEAASRGIIRPSGKSPPIIYDMKCTEFDLPYFTLELMCINEDETFLAEMVHQIGIYVRSCAVCHQLRLLQYGHFTLDHALLRKHWTLENIAANIILCKDLAELHNIIPSSAHFRQISKNEIKKKIRDTQNEAREYYLS